MPFEKGETPTGAKPFSKENQPKSRGRKKGSPNRSTLLRKWLSIRTTIKHPITKKLLKGTVEDEVFLALISRARSGDIRAIDLVLDSLYGKIPLRTELTGEDGSPILIELAEVLNHAYDSIDRERSS